MKKEISFCQDSLVKKKQKKVKASAAERDMNR